MLLFLILVDGMFVLFLVIIFFDVFGVCKNMQEVEKTGDTAKLIVSSSLF